MNEIDLGSEIYVDTNTERENLTYALGQLFGSSPDKYNNVETSIGELSVLKNDDFDEQIRKDEENGFLYYRYLLEIEPTEEFGKENAVEFVGKILDYLWSQGCPAVASCDYEELLPNNGGYKSPNVPKPQ